MSIGSLHGRSVECTTVSTHLLLLFNTVQTGSFLHQLRQRLLWLQDVANCLLLVSSAGHRCFGGLKVGGEGGGDKAVLG